MLHAKLSNIHILQGTLPTYLTIHTYLQSIFFATYLLHLNGIFAICSHFILIYVHTFERQLHAIYIHTYLHSFEEQFHVAHSLEKQFLYYSFTFLKGNFISYVPTLRSIFVPFSTYMHICKAFSYLFNIHMYMVNNIFTLSRYQENMVQPEPSVGLKGKPHQYVPTFMSSCISTNKGLGPLGLSHVLAFILNSTIKTHLHTSNDEHHL